MVWQTMRIVRNEAKERGEKIVLTDNNLPRRNEIIIEHNTSTHEIGLGLNETEPITIRLLPHMVYKNEPPPRACPVNSSKLPITFTPQFPSTSFQPSVFASRTFVDIQWGGTPKFRFFNPCTDCPANVAATAEFTLQPGISPQRALERAKERSIPWFCKGISHLYRSPFHKV